MGNCVKTCWFCKFMFIKLSNDEVIGLEMSREIDSYEVLCTTGQCSNNVINSSMQRQQKCRDLFSFSILITISSLSLIDCIFCLIIKIIVDQSTHVLRICICFQNVVQEYAYLYLSKFSFDNKFVGI
ncbi:unnamed protein product [Rotaria magnacalcarata]